jgi:hypothetical protein
MSEPAKKPQPAMTASDAWPATKGPPVGYNVRLAWLHLTRNDLTIGGTSIYDKVNARRNVSLRGNDIYWSATDRHYWIGRFDDNGNYVSHCRIWEGHVGTSGEWEG